MSSLHLPATTALLLSELSLTFNIFWKGWTAGLELLIIHLPLCSLTPSLLTCLNTLTHPKLPSYFQNFSCHLWRYCPFPGKASPSWLPGLQTRFQTRHPCVQLYSECPSMKARSAGQLCLGSKSSQRCLTAPICTQPFFRAVLTQPHHGSNNPLSQLTFAAGSGPHKPFWQGIRAAFK